MIIIDGKNLVLGRLATLVAKKAMMGEEVSIVNSDQIIITGNKTTIQREFKEKRSRFGSSHKGPVHHRVSEKIVKRAIRGMLPDHRFGRGKEALQKIKCYSGIPEEFKDKEFFKIISVKKIKFSKVGEFTK